MDVKKVSSREALDEYIAAQAKDEKDKAEQNKFVDSVWKIVSISLQDVKPYKSSDKTPAVYRQFNIEKDISSLEPHLKHLLFNYIKCNFYFDVRPSSEDCAMAFWSLLGDPAHGGCVSWESIAEAQVAVSMVKFKIVAPPVLRHSEEVAFDISLIAMLESGTTATITIWKEMTVSNCLLMSSVFPIQLQSKKLILRQRWCT